MSTEGLMEPVPGVEPTKSGLYIWRYQPNTPAAVIFLILFAGSSLLITWQIRRSRARFCIAFAVGGFLEAVGYGIRAGANSNTGSLMLFVIQSAFILVAPVLFAASIYMTLGRLITSVNGDGYSLVAPSKITLTFVLGDIASFIVQGGGAGMSVIQNANLAKWAERIIVIGLLIQVVMFGLFCVLAVVFHWRMKRASTYHAVMSMIPWETCLCMLYGVSFLIMVRSIFRVIEYTQGQTGYALSHEWTLYVFDAVLMFAVTVIFAWKHPGNLGEKTVSSTDGMEMRATGSK